MKIVYCIAKTHGSGGMERVLSTKANFLSKRGYEIVIITTDQCGKESFFPLEDGIRCYDLGINYETNNGKTFLNKLIHYPIKQQKHKQRLSVLLNELHADIVISMFCNDASFVSDIKDGSKKILEIHFSKFKRIQYGRKGLWGIADRLRSKNDERIVKKFDRFVVLTHEDRAYWGNLFNIEVIPNPLPFRTRTFAELKNKKVIAIGRYEHQKGFDLLIAAWAIVNKTHPDWNLDIIGEGDLRGHLQRLISDRQLDDSISLIPPTNQLDNIYRQSSILVMSSRYEGFGMVLAEAQSFGVPVISFACKCGPRDIISHGIDGYLVFELDVERLADRIIELIDNFDLRKLMGQAARENSERFLQSRIMNNWLTLFDDLTINRDDT